MSEATMVDVMRYFDMKPATFKKEWAALSPESKTQFKAGVGDGSLSY